MARIETVVRLGKLFVLRQARSWRRRFQDGRRRQNGGYDRQQNGRCRAHRPAVDDHRHGRHGNRKAFHSTTHSGRFETKPMRMFTVRPLLVLERLEPSIEEIPAIMRRGWRIEEPWPVFGIFTFRLEEMFRLPCRLDVSQLKAMAGAGFYVCAQIADCGTRIERQKWHTKKCLRDWCRCSCMSRWPVDTPIRCHVAKAAAISLKQIEATVRCRPTKKSRRAAFVVGSDRYALPKWCGSTADWLVFVKHSIEVMMLKRFGQIRSNN